MKDKQIEETDWLSRCLSCKHCYTRQDEADEIRCRCRKGKCNYEEVELKNDRSKRDTQ